MCWRLRYVCFCYRIRKYVARDNAGGPLLLEDGDKDWTLVGVLRGGGVDCLDLQYDTEGTLIINDATSEWSKISVQTEWIEKIILMRTPKTTMTTETSIIREIRTTRRAIGPTRSIIGTTRRTIGTTRRTIGTNRRRIGTSKPAQTSILDQLWRANCRLAPYALLCKG